MRDRVVPVTASLVQVVRWHNVVGFIMAHHTQIYMIKPAGHRQDQDYGNDDRFYVYMRYPGAQWPLK
jgi:hypothetical protein